MECLLCESQEVVATGKLQALVTYHCRNCGFDFQYLHDSYESWPQPEDEHLEAVYEERWEEE